MHNPKSVEFHQCHVKRHSICFLPQYQDLLTTENTDSDLKVHALLYANELLVRLRLPFKTFCKLAQNAEPIRKNVWEKRNDA